MKIFRPVFIFALLIYHLNSFAYTAGMVVSEKKIASNIGADILSAGGNAIDAAIAVGYALAVIYPCCGNIGGGGFMTIHLANGQNVFINFREKAPLLAREDMFTKTRNENASTIGYQAVATPGTVLGFETALKKFGTMTRKQVMAPAIQLAKQGYVVTAYDADQLSKFLPKFKSQANVANIFLKKGLPFKSGQRIVQLELANTLQQISNHGASYFYLGPIAKEISKQSKQYGGLLTLSDFQQYKVEITKPITCQYHHYDILSAPPPSSGGVILCEMLNILENFSLNKTTRDSVESNRLLIEAMHHGFDDRNNKLGDPDFIKNPTKELLSKEYAKKISLDILNNRFSKPTNTPIQIKELTDTTHYSVMDKYGNAVAVTYTINGFFGAGIMAGNTGFFLNNEMDDFTTMLGEANKFGLVQGNKNAVAPAKRPLSSMAPSIIMKNGSVVMVLGSPGGPRIITSTLLTIVNMLDYHMSLRDAVNMPRFHYQGEPNLVDMEPFAFSALTKRRLESLGYHFVNQAGWGAVETIYVNPQTNVLVILPHTCRH
ncbi:MAG: gamma-glutamyltransferase [Gammaproteobacteria bacterium]